MTDVRIPNVRKTRIGFHWRFTREGADRERSDLVLYLGTFGPFPIPPLQSTLEKQLRQFFLLTDLRVENVVF